MIIYIFVAITVINYLLTFMFFGMFFKIREDVNLLTGEKKKEINIFERLINDLVHHDQMKEYLSKIENQLTELHKEKEKRSSEKWKTMKQAFGGKTEED